MIDWKKAENAKKIKVFLKDGSEIVTSGNGLEIGEDIGEDEDMFFTGYQESSMMIPVSQIKNIEIKEL